MKSKTSFWNKSIFNYFISNSFWLLVLYFIGMIFIKPFALLVESVMLSNTTNSSPEAVQQMSTTFLSTTQLQIAITILFVIGFVILQWNFKNNEDSSDFMHALPVKRHALFTHGIIVGLGGLILVTFITGVITYLLQFALIFDISFMTILQWFLYSSFVIFVVYSMTLLVGQLVNRMTVHAVLAGAVIGLVYITWMLIIALADTLFNGIVTSSPFRGFGEATDLYTSANKLNFPLVALEQVYDGYNLTDIVMWSVIAVIMLVLSYVLYEIRKNEKVNVTFNYNWLRILLTAWLSIIGMMMLGLVTMQIFSDQKVLSIIGFTVGLIIAYIITEMVFQNSVRLEFNKASIITTLLSVVIFTVVFLASWQLYTTQVPTAENVEAIHVSNSTSYFPDANKDWRTVLNDDFLFLKDQALIEEVVQKHQHIVDNQSGLLNLKPKSGRFPIKRFDVTYRFENGKIKSYQYVLDDREHDYMKSLDHAYNNEEAILSTDILWNIEATNQLIFVMFQNGAHQGLQESEAQEFVKEYQEHIEKTGVEALYYKYPNLTPTVSVEIGFGKNSANESQDVHNINLYGYNTNTYNPALQKYLKSSIENYPEYNLVDYIELRELEQGYLVELEDEEEVDEFIDALTSRSIAPLIDEYDVTILKNDELEDIKNDINDLKLDGNSTTLFIYSPYFHHEDLSIEDTGERLHYYILGLDR